MWHKNLSMQAVWFKSFDWCSEWRDDDNELLKQVLWSVFAELKQIAEVNRLLSVSDVTFHFIIANICCICKTPNYEKMMQLKRPSSHSRINSSINLYSRLMEPFDRSHTTSYSFSIVTCPVTNDLEWLWGHFTHLKTFKQFVFKLTILIPSPLNITPNSGTSNSFQAVLLHKRDKRCCQTDKTVTSCWQQWMLDLVTATDHHCSSYVGQKSHKL